jgi:hypothetical protein
MAANKIVLSETTSIGHNGAEHDDQFLFKCFVDHPAYSEITDPSTPTTFLLGSTGAGKTAMLRMIKKREQNVHELEIHNMAMNHIANSDTISFLKNLDVDLTLFFQALWRHIFCIEYIKITLNAASKDQFKFKFRKIIESLHGGRQTEKLEAFVAKNETQFWNTLDENIVELTESFEDKFSVDFGGEVKKFSAKAGYVHGLGSQQKVQLQQRAKKFLNDMTLSELPHVISALSEYTQGRQDKYFITVDGLDEHWVDEGVKFQLLQALFECLKGLKKLRNFQVVVALRNDLYFRMINETPTSQRQIEKYEDLMLRLKWSKAQLRDLADRRMREMFKWQYSSDIVSMDDVFKQYPDGRTTPWEYIYERTLRRPRDVINFINLALQASEGSSAVSKNSFLKGEANYSNLRLETLIHEWSGTFPAISVLLDLLRGRPAYRQASELMQTGLIGDVYDGIGANSSMHRDDLWAILTKYVAGDVKLEPSDLSKIILARLHLIGAIGLKLAEDRPWDWIFDTQRPVDHQHIDGSTKFRVHPMLFVALSIRK